MSNYDEYIDNVKKWSNVRMRMIKRCVAHKAQVSAQRYRNSIALENGLLINGKIMEI